MICFNHMPSDPLITLLMARMIMKISSNAILNWPILPTFISWSQPCLTFKSLCAFIESIFHSRKFKTLASSWKSQPTFFSIAHFMSTNLKAGEAFESSWDIHNCLKFYDVPSSEYISQFWTKFVLPYLQNSEMLAFSSMCGYLYFSKLNMTLSYIS